MARFAEGTEVPVERSKAEIEKMLTRYGADQFMSGWRNDKAVIGFRAKERYVRFDVYVPPLGNPLYKTAPAGRTRSPADQKTAFEKENRRRWRALCLVIKAKLEAVESGIETFEQSFMPHIVMPDGRTFGDTAARAIQIAYDTGDLPPLLPDYSK